ncbi:class I adenylate-forming enzyme family protein [Azospirillum sp.]|uniref:class I adenylate-forming enzyme family protein n=1 Tax=Azospirillum sp. TaxID=34012 RepID=UPI002D3E2284|nr:AMP-binding protein [Azospirillum sp.]HYD69007.1 AMP-binding protein [Azospirillum sp.]
MRLETILFAHCRRHPDKEAVVCGERRLTYGALEASIRSLASGLRGQGLGPGDRIVLYLPNGTEFVELLYAALALGAIAIPVTTRLTLKELAYFCEDSGATMVAFAAAQAEGMRPILEARPALRGIVVGVGVGGEGEAGLLAFAALADAPAEPLPVLAEDREECMIMYTSGTTGRPKGVVLTHANILVNHGFMNAVEWGIRADDRYLVASPLAHRAGLGRLMNAMTLGGTIHVATAFEPDHIVEVIERERITVFGMVPTMCRLLLPSLERDPARCRSLRLIVVTGEAFPVELKERLIRLLPDVQLVSFFAMTEAGAVTNLSHAEQFTHPKSVGRPAPGVETRIVDAEGNDVEPGGVGELLVRSGRPGAFTIMKGYFNRPEDTARALAGGWFHTGDMARVDGDGYVHIVDRKKDMILSGGFNIYSKEVELAIVEVAGVADAAVVGVPDPVYGEAVAAFVEADAAGTPPTAEQIIAHCRDAIASYKKPKHVFFVDALPRNAVGKVMKHQLADLARARLAEAGGVGGAP